MKRIGLLLLVLCLMVSLSGCFFFLPFTHFPGSTDKPTEATELPTQAQVDPLLGAEDIYWRSKLAFSGRAFRYTQSITTQFTYVYEDESFPMDMNLRMQVALDPEVSAVNVLTDYSYQFLFEDYCDSYADYYRDEDGKLIYYYHNMQTQECTREEIPLDGQTPYAIIGDYTLIGYPYPVPEDIAVEPQTRMLGDREVYVLTYTQSPLDLFGYTGNEATDAVLAKRRICATWYVDVETYQTLRQELSVSKLDDVLGSYLLGSFGLDTFLEPGSSIDGFSYVLEDLSFQPVELPEIPQDVLQKAWENAGFNAT